MDRRDFFGESARLALALAAAPGALRAVSAPRDSMTLFLCGDVMTGRGIDQILPTPGDPRLHERWVEDAREYVRLAEQENGPIPAPVDPAYLWGHALDVLHRVSPLIDEARVDAIHGHSSHHPLGIEIYRDRPILYGCGDFINDYEGIGGREEFRGNLSLMYFPRFELATGRLAQLRLVPCRIERFRPHPASVAETEWLRGTLDRESSSLGSRVVAAGDGALEVVPEGAGLDASGVQAK